ncbi:hypothetical protein GP486_001525 [Trichoglossum hirsutum]|uniref:Uncharacterized protein n=1 Tax=Trichoglossum hirsutum TaxID=265104 RepID=A0A9P8LGR3_9PEZI|nr:hypothetical protein GP486_001525 [Trichoglossum hirsutum]
MELALQSFQELDSDGEYLDLADFPEISDNPSVLFTFAVGEIRNLVNALLNSLPSVLHVASTLEEPSHHRVRIVVPEPLNLIEDRSTAITQLLDVSLQLTATVSNALNQVEQVPDEADLEESLKSLFDKEAAALRKWREKNGPKMEGKLTSHESASVPEILTLYVKNNRPVDNIPSLAKDNFAEYSALEVTASKLLDEYAERYPELGLKLDRQQPQDIRTAVRAFRSCVEELTSLELTLHYIEPPPAYEQRRGNKFLVDVEGELVQSSAQAS